MFCYHCGYKVDTDKIEAKQSTYNRIEGLDMDTKINYVCPRCGHLVHADASEEDVKSLARACHAELQRGRNDFARGMSNISIGIILLVTSIVFLLLAFSARSERVCLMAVTLSSSSSLSAKSAPLTACS